jgi:capsular exopolysaccharide synthesis family protein
MTLRSYVQVLRKRWRLVAAVTLLCLAGAVGITASMPVTYSSTATSFVAIQRTADDPTSLYQTSQFAMQRVKSYTRVVESPAVLEPVIHELGLSGGLSALRKTVSAENPVDTVLLEVTAQAGSPALVAEIANAVSKNLGREIERLESPRLGGTSPVKVSLSVPAAQPMSPVSPRRTLNLALGLLSGLALGIVLAVIRDAQDTSIKIEDVQDLTGRSPLGFVGFNPRFPSDPLLTLDESGPSTEEFRTIRTNLQFTDVDNPPRRIVVTSSVANEGKSTVAANLALALAQSNRVCLVEADLRRPKISEYYGLEGSVGLSNVLAGQYELDDALVFWNRGMLAVLPAGTEPPDPSQLLASRTMETVHEQLTSRFDYIVFDAPPVLPVSDAMVLASASDGVMFISRYGHTKRDLVERALEQLTSVHVRLIGTIVTFVPPRNRRAVRGDIYSHKYAAPRGASEATRGKQMTPDSGASAIKVEAPAPGGKDKFVGETSDPHETLSTGA